MVLNLQFPPLTLSPDDLHPHGVLSSSPLWSGEWGYFTAR